MHRPDHSTRAINFDGLGHDGYSDGNPGSGVKGTVWVAAQSNDMVEGLCRLVEAAGLPLVKGNFDQIDQAVRVLSGAGEADGFGNLLINGGFRFWQRGASIALAASTPAYTASRWRGNPGTSGVATITKQTFAPAGAPHSSLPPEYLQWQQTTGGTAPVLEQRVEQLDEIDATKQTFSVWLRVTSGSISVTPRLTQNFGSGGSADVVTNGAAWTVTTTWTRFSVTFDVPSISGKTVGGNDRFTSFGMVMPSSSTFTMQVAGAKVNPGPVAAPFSRISDAVEYVRISRFEWKTYEVDTAPGTVTSVGSPQSDDTGNLCEGTARPFPVAMRTSPAITYYSPRTGAVGQVERPIGADTAASSTSFNSAKNTGAVNTLAVVTGQCRVHAFYDAEL